MVCARLFRLLMFSIVVSTTSLAQQVAGTARLADSGGPAGGTAVLLVNTAGVIIAGTLSASDGGYLLHAPSAGKFRVRARRMGFAPDSSNELLFELGGELHFDPILKPVTSSLQVVSVVGVQRCKISRESGAIASRLWEAAQNALSATIAAADGGQIAFRLTRFERELEPATGRVVRETVSQLRASNSEPYHSLSPDSLAKVGYAHAEGDSSVYFAPDARTLTSEVFTETHCLRPVEDRAKPTQIGLGFEPVAHSRLVDVGGVLWFDRASSELRDLDYRYEFPNAIRSSTAQSTESAAGHIEYRRLDSGGWIVNRWVIRVPIQVEERANTLSSNGNNDLILRSSRATGTRAVWEIGGAVADVFKPADSLLADAQDPSQLLGSVIMGATQSGVPGVNVALSLLGAASQNRSSQTSLAGTFTFDNIPAGNYLLSASAAAFDTLNAIVAPLPVVVSPGTRQTVTIAVPSAEEARAALCPGVSPASPLVHGMVQDSATGRPIVGARVDAYWLTGTVRTGAIGGGLAASAHERTTLTDTKGKYVFCDMEPTTRLLLSASVGARKSRRGPSLTLVERGIRMANLTLPR
jgi:hypothetical protein